MLWKYFVLNFMIEKRGTTQRRNNKESSFLCPAVVVEQLQVPIKIISNASAHSLDIGQAASMDIQTCKLLLARG